MKKLLIILLITLGSCISTKTQPTFNNKKPLVVLPTNRIDLILEFTAVVLIIIIGTTSLRNQ